MKKHDINDKPMYNSMAINTYIHLIKSKYQYIDVENLLKFANMKEEELENSNHWFSQNQINAFMEKLISLTGKQNIGYEAGIYTTSPEALGRLRSYFIGLGSPINAYEKINDIANKLTRSSTYEARQINSNKIEITVTKNPHIHEEIFQCDNRLGYFKGIFRLFNRELPRIEHPECMFRGGGNVCRYIISWNLSFWTIVKRFLLISNSVLFFSLLLISWNHSLQFLPYYLLIYFIILYYANKKEFNEIINSNDILYHELYNLIETNYKYTETMRKVSKELGKANNLDDILKKVCNILKENLDFDRGSIMFVNQEKTGLVHRANFGYTTEELQYWEQEKGFRIDRHDSKGAFVKAFREQTAEYINDIDLIKNQLSERSQKLIEKLRVKSLICCPIIYDNKSLGILAVDNKMKKQNFIENDISLLMGLASQLGIAINNFNETKENQELLKRRVQENLSMRAVHNIRTPADAINTWIYVLFRDYKFETEVKKIHEQMKENIKRILDLVMNFMRYQQPIEVRFKRVDLTKELNNAFSKVITKIEIHNLDKKIRVDIEGIKYVFEELLRNAKKNGASKTFLHGEYITKFDKLKLFFTDNGYGISKENINILFKPYQSSDQFSTGIGLSICKKIIDEHNGEIYFDSNYTGGTRFNIEIPAL